MTKWHRVVFFSSSQLDNLSADDATTTFVFFHFKNNCVCERLSADSCVWIMHVLIALWTWESLNENIYIWPFLESTTKIGSVLNHLTNIDLNTLNRANQRTTIQSKQKRRQLSVWQLHLICFYCFNAYAFWTNEFGPSLSARLCAWSIKWVAHNSLSIFFVCSSIAQFANILRTYFVKLEHFSCHCCHIIKCFASIILKCTAAFKSSTAFNS